MLRVYRSIWYLLYVHTHTVHQIHSACFYCGQSVSLYPCTYIFVCVWRKKNELHTYSRIQLNVTVFVCSFFFSFAHFSARSFVVYCVIHSMSMLSTKCTNVRNTYSHCNTNIYVVARLFIHTHTHTPKVRHIWAIWWNDKHESWLIQHVNWMYMEIYTALINRKVKYNEHIAFKRDKCYRIFYNAPNVEYCAIRSYTHTQTNKQFTWIILKKTSTTSNVQPLL